MAIMIMAKNETVVRTQRDLASDMSDLILALQQWLKKEQQLLVIVY